ncbi:hypothetical protein MLD38_010762 [Melastoma candidum]|uniref:Uncharacterized protein n=1 Tax=Melastoma candidum TaxID=119954 RepID=A0ACB9R1F6_9MYRT|nr:hypothetical protein MLD38_010762 [Melastoma candidum]
MARGVNPATAYLDWNRHMQDRSADMNTLQQERETVGCGFATSGKHVVKPTMLMPQPPNSFSELAPEANKITATVARAATVSLVAEGLISIDASLPSSRRMIDTAACLPDSC